MGVAYFRQNACAQWLLGVDYLDRDDVRLLPVFGLLWTPSDDWRIDLVQPFPFGTRMDFAIRAGFAGTERDRDSSVRRFSFRSRGPISGTGTCSIRKSSLPCNTAAIRA